MNNVIRSLIVYTTPILIIILVILLIVYVIRKLSDKNK